jgi:glyoxylase-like metal-dependent hydrolase (beta-lactamase superfamily II)
LVTEGWDRVRLLNDEDQIAPGLRTWWCGGHHRASLAVEVETPEGVVIASDAFFYYENVEKDRPLGINESLQEIQSAYARARQADHLLPLYDPKVYERYTGGVISAIQRLGESPR